MPVSGEVNVSASRAAEQCSLVPAIENDDSYLFGTLSDSAMCVSLAHSFVEQN